MAKITKSIAAFLIILICHSKVTAQNYIRYHQRSLMVQEHIASGELAKATACLTKLEKRYGLMPTETFALALCQVAAGDTANAHRTYLKCMEQHGLLVWLYIKPPALYNHADSSWYGRVVSEAKIFRQTHPEFVDGPTGTIPTVLTQINSAHQNFLDSVGRVTGQIGAESADESLYETIQRRHDEILDSMITGKLGLFTVQAYGVNTDLQTFLLHVSPTVMNTYRKHVRRWLKRGFIYPDDYAASVDGPAYRLQHPMTYKFYRSSDDIGVRPGYEDRRWKIGMGNDRLNALRFVRTE